MAVDLVKSREEVLSPSAPCIVKNLAQVEGGCEIIVSEDYVHQYGNVLKAGHLVSIESSTDTEGGHYVGYNALNVADNAFRPVDEIYDFPPDTIGVLTHDAVVSLNENGRYSAYGSLMIAGIVDASKMPYMLTRDDLDTNIREAHSNSVVYLNLY